MSFAHMLVRLPHALRSRHAADRGLFLDEKSFRFELARERMRVDRNGSTLAVLTIQLPSDRSTSQDYDFLGRLLLRRLRITDTVGFLSDRRVGVLLPDTPKSGAWKVASDICSVYPVGHDRPDCDVLIYPDDSSPRHEPARLDGARNVRGGAPSSTPTSIDTLLAEALPPWKRAIDVIGATAGLIAAAPLLLLCAAAIKLTSPGPVIYTQEREGLAGRRFQMYKLRTMHVNAEQQQAALRAYSEQDGPAFKMTSDPRTTWIGRFLRHASLDELPQLWNVLRGEMSLVGPRPLPTCESLACEPWHRQRLRVTPGITCIWQVNGRSTVSFEEWMRMDLQYVKGRSLIGDLRLLVTTGPSLVLKRGPR